ncbi:MAG: hypothetical protein AABY10_04085 [Nanoarchaeota archaeon]
MGSVERLIEDLFVEARGRQVCPHIKRDSSRMPYCGKDLPGGQETSQTRYDICGAASLQLYCLDEPERHTKCIYYKGEPLD